MTQSSRFATAVHILTLLAGADDEPLTSDYVAGSVNTNPVVIRRLLGVLVKAGLVTSTPGGAGGSRLARDARKITLFDVYDAVESGGLFGTHSQRPNPKCPVGRNIAELLARRVETAESAAAASLRKTTVADLFGEVKKRT
ncbi:MAG TPA: Rrf2 family transcriptional regulator [Thermoanaerobaculia bacterium]|jgi:Rrf2 family protein|nr:Rrf2 family transcriptional regulator [Thermoanaerobaculia bacterium]